MADEPILGLFDSDTNFLDELTGNADLGGVMSTDGDGMLSQGMGPTAQMGPGPSQMATSSAPQMSNPMGIPQGAAGHGVGYPQMGTDGYHGMGAAVSASGPQYGGGGEPSYSQYQPIPKMGPHHGEGMMGMPQQQGMLPQQQFGSPPAGGMMAQHGYQSYGMPGGPQQQQVSMMGQQHGMIGPQQGMMGQQQGMIGQQQSMMGQQGLLGQQSMMGQQASMMGTQQGMMGPQQGMMGQQQGMIGQQQGMMGQQQQGAWSAPQTSPGSSHPPYMSPQGQQQNMGMGQGSWGHPEYSMQQMQPNMGHYGDNAGYMPQQVPPMGSPGGMNMMSSMQRQPRPQYHPASPMRQNNPAMGSYGMQQAGQRFAGDYMAQRQGMSQASQRFPFPPSSGAGASSMGPDGSAMAHYPSQSQGSYLPYPVAPHTAGPLSPHAPTGQAVPASSGSMMGQGAYGQSSLQELEQLVSPTMSTGNGMPNSNPYQQIMHSSGSNTPNTLPQSPVYSSSSFPTSTLSSSPVPVQAVGNMCIGSSGPLSPNQSLQPGMAGQNAVGLEINRLEKQIQHLMSLPKTQQVNQQMMDMQEHLRMLKSQQQQMMQMQRQQQQPPVHMNSPTRMGGKPAFSQQQQQQHMGVGQARSRLPGPGSMQVHSPMSGMGLMGVATGPSSAVAGGPMQMSGPQTPQRPPSQSGPISSPQKIQPFQSPTSSTPGDGIMCQTPPSQLMVVQQAADSMTDPVQMTPPLVLSTSMSDMGKVMTSDPLPATVTEIAEAQEGQGEKPKRKRERKPKADKPPKEPKPPKEKKPRAPKIPKEPKEPKEPKPPKEKKPRAPRTPKEPKEPKPPKPPKEKKPRVRKSSKKSKEEGSESASGSELNVSTVSEVSVISVESSDPSLPTTTTTVGDVTVGGDDVVIVVAAPEGEVKDDGVTPKKKPRDRKPRTPKTIVKALKKPSAKKKKPPASLFLKKRKRKKAGSDGSDVEINLSPPGSPPADDDSSKRRSSRNTKKTKYQDFFDINLSDDEHTLPVDNSDGPVAMKTESEEDTLVVEKILGSRMRKRDAEEMEEVAEPEDEEEEFYLKYKNYSYLHCEWKTMSEIGDKRFLAKLKRYRLKKMQATFEEPEDGEYFNPDYVEVDRVLEMISSKDPVTDEEITHFLVKWRGLSYEESTWELQQDVDPNKVKLFKELRLVPPEDQRQVLARPKPVHWKKQESCQVYKGDNTLREYQLEGLNWLTFCWHNGQNCILADEMGLGKTIQSITFLNEMFHYGIKGPFLIIVPLSTIGNWQREFETWTDLNAVVYHGTSNSRSMIQEYELFYKDENGQRLQDFFKFHALITTYEIIIADVELLTSIEWRCCVIDEAHRLKNRNCRLLEGLRLFDIEHRVLLTGTPLQNNTEELFSLLNFLNPGKFSSSINFNKEYGDLKTEAQVDSLKEILKPMMLRRLKEDVEKNLAPKEETIIEVELTNIQKKYYRAILERNFQFLSKGGTTSMPSLMNTMMELRKCCNHPYLINGAEDQILEERGARGNHEMMLAALVASAGKMVLLDKLLPRLKQDGHKVLIFSQMIRVLDIIEDYLIQKKHLYERLDGRIRGNLRQEAIDRFSKPDSDRFVFLLCTRAGGLGINLTAADTVVIYDSDWNPQNDLQAQARCHRIGQSKAVKVYRLITRNSYEREMFDKASLKLGLDKAVLQSMGTDKNVNAGNQLSKKEVEDLLKKGAYGALMEDDSAGDKFCEEDIDLILQRRTKVIQIESEGKGSTFAKASFSVSENRTDIDIDDPNFWAKWAKQADIDVDALANKNELIVKEPRQRKQTARYGNEEAAVDISDLESSTDSENEMKMLRRGRKTRRGGRGYNDMDFSISDDISTAGYTRNDCFKVEKHLLVYGWGRWQDVIRHAHFKHNLTEGDVHIIARAILAHSLKFYNGDERIKEFIWDLIATAKEGNLKNHMGLSAPVPRGRKGKKAKEKRNTLDESRTLDFDPDTVLDSGYKRHLHRHSNKVLLRVRLLYYIKQEVIGNEAARVFEGVKCSELYIPTPIQEGEIPAPWWDMCADRCLLIGVFKHGYEKFNQMRQDSSLCFLSRCGPPDGAALLAEQNDDKEDEDELDEKLLKDDDEGEVSQSSAPDVTSTTTTTQPISVQTDESGETKCMFPAASDLNLRLRRIITGYQRSHKKRMQKEEQFAKRMERREQAQMMVSERVKSKKDFQQGRWTRREESDFYRTVSTFGVEFDRESGRFKWDRFRQLAHLDRKYDDTITEYFHAFYYMCQSVCGKFRSDDRVPPPPNGIFVEPITEERASRCLARIDLLNKIRDDIIPHPKLDERLQLCQQSFDMPPWWLCGKHDKELLLGAAKHGVAHTECTILRDPEFSFQDMVKTKSRHLRSSQHQYAPSPLASTPVSHLRMTPGLHGDEDLESDAKSQDSADLRERDSSSPPLLHVRSDKVQYPLPASISTTDTDSEGGPPKLERAVSSPATQDKEEGARQSGSALEEEDAGSSPSPPSLLQKTMSQDTDNDAESQDTNAVLLGAADNRDSQDSCSPSAKRPKLEVAEIGDAKDSHCDSVSDSKTAGSDSDNAPVKPEQTSVVVDIKPEQMEVEAGSETSEIKDSTVSASQPEQESKLLLVKAEPRVSEGSCTTDTVEAEKVDEVVSDIKSEIKEEVSSADGSEMKQEGRSDDEKSEPSTVSCDERMSLAEEEKPEFVKLKEKIMQGELERVQREKQALREGLVSTGVGVDGLSPLHGFGPYDPDCELDGLEPGEIVPGRPFMQSTIDWPKDRVIFHRLEHICYTVEHGEWPFARRQQSFLQSGMPYDSRSGTPVGSSTPRPDNAPENGEAAAEQMLSLNQVMPPQVGDQSPKEFEVRVSLQNEGLKMTFHKRGRGRGRGGGIGSSRNYDMDHEKAARVHQLLSQSAQTMAASDNENQPEPVNLSTPLSTPHSTPQPTGSHPVSSHQSSGHKLQNPSPHASTFSADSPMNGSPMSDMEQQFQNSMMDQGYLYPERRRRGRKRKAEKMMEQAMAEALAKRDQARILSTVDPEARVPVVNMEDGSVLTGEEAPRKRHLEQWLQDHPGYLVSGQGPASLLPFPMSLPEERPPPHLPIPDLHSTPMRERRKPGRKPKLDPRTLYGQKLTGEENVSVIERGTGRKPQSSDGNDENQITGAKAPPLKHLKEWLEQNPTFDVDPKWGDLLRAQGSLPSSLDSRLLKPSGRGRKPRSAGALHSSLLGAGADFSLHGMAAFPGAAGLLAGGFPKLPMGLPFANLASLGLANPMLGLAAAGFSLPGFLTGAPGEEGKEGGGSSSKDKRDKPQASSSSDRASPSTSTAAPHPSFPNLFFNPLAFNPLLASQLRNFPIPGFANLNMAHLAALNSLPENMGLTEEELLAAAATATAGIRKDMERSSKHERPATSSSRSDRSSSSSASKLPERSASLAKSEKGQGLNKVLEKISSTNAGGQSASGTPAATAHASTSRKSGMNVGKDSTPTPAHSQPSKAPVSVTMASEDQACDLSFKAKAITSSPAHTPAAPTASTPALAKSRKIQKSSYLDRIVDSLKERMEEKTKKMEDREEEAAGAYMGPTAEQQPSNYDSGIKDCATVNPSQPGTEALSHLSRSPAESVAKDDAAQRLGQPSPISQADGDQATPDTASVPFLEAADTDTCMDSEASTQSRSTDKDDHPTKVSSVEALEKS